MQRLRKLARTRTSGGLLAVYLAYALAIQGLMASVGIGMSAAAAASGQGGFILCSAAAAARVPGGDRQNPSPRPQCPFCFVAGQSAGHFATLDGGPPFPTYDASPIAGTLPCRCHDAGFIPQFRRKAGEPRAPPAVSV